MEVKELMNPGVVWVEPTATAALAARLLSRHNLGALPVCAGDGRLRGMVTDRDIVLRCVAAEDDPAQTMVRDIMTRSCAAVSPHADCRQAAQLMSRQQVRRLPVVEEGRLVGMLSLADLARSHRYDMEAAQALSEISENIVWGGKEATGPGRGRDPAPVRFWLRGRRRLWYTDCISFTH